MTSTVPASMGGPLSEAEAAAGRIRAYLDADTGSESFGRLMPYELPDGAPRDLSRADLVAILNGFGVLEGQLAKAADPVNGKVQLAIHRATCEDSLAHCAENRGRCVRSAEAASWALGLDGGDDRG